MRMLKRVCLALVIMSAANPVSAAEQRAAMDDSDSHLDKTVDDFTLPTHRGVSWKLSDQSAARYVVVAFLGTECPLAKLYGPRLNELAEEFADDKVVFVGINSNTQDSISELTQYVAQHKLGFALLKDLENRVADRFGAERTPEVFVLDAQRRVCYHGRIDDQYGVGTARDKAQRHDLAEALRQLVAGEEVSVRETEAVGCIIGRVRRQVPTGDITYSGQIAAIFNRRCVECHRAGEVAPFSLESYDDIVGWEDMIVEVVQDQRMPPWYASPEHGHFRNDARLTDEEKQLIYQWVENGIPAGDLEALPTAPDFADGWRMPEPHQVVKMSDEEVAVPADGVVDYQYFVVDPHWAEDRYLCAAEARPGNRAVVHHIIVYLLPPGVKRLDENRVMLAGYAPGAQPYVLPAGLAAHVPAGSKLVFEMHYTPNGSPQTDLSYVGFRFTDKESVKHLLRGRAAVNQKFEIPAGADDHAVVAHYTSRVDEKLLRMTPHMHLRGKSFRYEARFPDGTKEVLLDVPKYDFNWQLSYELAEPKLLPKGTRVVCTARYDNSADNPFNPDPTVAVRWGDQSWHEMMIGFFDVIPEP